MYEKVSDYLEFASNCRGGSYGLWLCSAGSGTSSGTGSGTSSKTGSFPSTITSTSSGTKTGSRTSAGPGLA